MVTFGPLTAHCRPRKSKHDETFMGHAVNAEVNRYHRAVLMSAVRDMIRRAREARADLPAAAPDRQFFLGVAAAASEVLTPELSVSRMDGWLDLESAEFREGYLRAATVLATAQAAPDPPLRLRLPEPDEPERGETRSQA